MEKMRKRAARIDYWDQILQIVKLEEPATIQQIIQAARRFDGQPSFRKIDHEVCQMARLKVIRREWIETEDWHKAQEVFTL